ncbi:MAG: hypothetical protein KAW47_10805 [Thermoplasmatales archaeon]|nr:hypothetical protein [Thermoplasmatales archaeon]
MSKLKCWKKVSDEYWKNKNKNELFLDKLDDQWDVMLEIPEEEDMDHLYGTTSKKDATRFVREYMEEHDTC